MRITIDTELQCIIVPNSYYAQIDRLNEIIEAAGGKRLDYTQYIRDCFENTFKAKIICQSEVSQYRACKTKRSSAAKKNDEAGQAES